MLLTDISFHFILFSEVSQLLICNTIKTKLKTDTTEADKGQKLPLTSCLKINVVHTIKYLP